MTQTDKMPAETKRRLAVWRRRLASFRYGTAWRVLVKTAAACLLTALLIFVYAQEIAKWWGAPFLIVGAAAICAIPAFCTRCRREIARLEQECARLEQECARLEKEAKEQTCVLSPAARAKGSALSRHGNTISR